MTSSTRAWRKAIAAAQAAAIVCVASLAGPAPALAQERPAVGSAQDARLVATLVRATLIALHQANATGNYTVLRDLGAPSFRERNTAAALALGFAGLRARGIDLQATAVLQPTITTPPVLDANALLRISGTFPTRPVPVRFDLAFQAVDRVWRLIALTVAPVEAAGSAGEEEVARGIPVPTPKPVREAPSAGLAASD